MIDQKVFGVGFVIGVILAFLGSKCHPADKPISPQRDLYKIDVRDWAFNNMDKPIAREINREKGGNGDGSRLLRELNIQIMKHEKGGK
jgi:hypothetical protein